MASRVEADILRRGTHPDGRLLTSAEREALILPHLPQPRSRIPQSHFPVSLLSSAWKSHDSGPNKANAFVSYRAEATPKIAALETLQSFIRLLLFKLIFLAVQFVFSAYIRGRHGYHAILYRILAILYYHHRTPGLIRRDVKALSRRPRHLSVILDYADVESQNVRKLENLRKLINDVAEISAWCACAGIPMLSVYERTGVLKSHIPSVHKSISATLRSYFPPSSIPGIQLRAPNSPTYSPPSSPNLSEMQESPVLSVLLLSATDGRDTLVDLTKTLAEMSQRGKLCPSDISADLIDAELTESSCGEPDLLILMAAPEHRRTWSVSKHGVYANRRGSHFASNDIGSARSEGYDGSFGTGSDVCLRGYPPWQVRLTEIFYVQDNYGVDYQVFLRALHSYAKAQMRYGR